MPFGVKKQLPGALRFFNLDLHLAVIADVKDTLYRLYGNKVHVTDWSINVQDGRRFGFEKPARMLSEVIAAEHQDGARLGIEGDPTLINTFSWYGFDQDLVDRFVHRYADELAKYDGFIVTHSPVFARLFERLKKPVVLVNSCRYDQPFCYNGDDEELHALNRCLQNLQQEGLLLAISNNRADQEYLRLGAGIDSVRVPSLCLYTKVSLDLERAVKLPPLIVSQKTLRIPEAKKELLREAGLVQTRTTKQSAASENSTQKFASWDVIHHRKALIHFPYEMSTMSLFEQYSAGAILLFPTQRFCAELMKNRVANNWQEHASSGNGTLRIASMYWASAYGQDAYKPLEELPPPFQALCAKYHHVVKQDERDPNCSLYELWNPDKVMPSALKCTEDIDWWLDRADFYDSEWFPGITYFDSWEELIELSKVERDAEQHRRHMEWLLKRKDKVLDIWRQLMESKFPQLKK